MLCALADYFAVTTDELLGRNPKVKYAVIASDIQDLGQQIAEKAKGYGFSAKHICGSLADAFEAIKADPSITHLFASFEKPLSEEEKHDGPDGLCFIEVQSDIKEQVLDGFELYFHNMVAYDSLALKRPIKA